MFKSLVIAAALTAIAGTAAAQAVSIDRKQVSVAAARKMVDACLAFAQANNLQLAAAVVGLDGVLIAYQTMEGAGPTTGETAILKAETAMHWRRSTRTLEEDVMAGRNQASLWINDFPKAGALPIMIQGQVAGAIGVGGPAKQDECAQAGIDAVIPPQATATNR
jgi:uncharacterized protein GlcG (DUF336 family)